MPFNTEQLAAAGKAAIDFYVKNDPIDQINTDRPLLKILTAGKKPYGGGLQYIVEQLRKSNDSNFQTYFGDGQVTYNRKRTLDQAKYIPGSFHDGFGLNEDELAQNGITVTDDKNAVASDAEVVQLTNLLNENVETLKLGFQENLDILLHRTNASDPDAIPGLDALISTTPASGAVGTINPATAANSWWRNYASLDIAQTDLIDEMEIAWRECTRYGGLPPDTILVGSDFLDAYRRAAGLTINRYVEGAGNQKGGVSLDASVSKTYFKNVELTWDPVMDVLDQIESVDPQWAKRCYFLNTRFLTLRPIKGHWMVSRKPPRVYDRYVHYWALTGKAALTTGKRNSMAVLSVY